MATVLGHSPTNNGMGHCENIRFENTFMNNLLRRVYAHARLRLAQLKMTTVKMAAAILVKQTLYLPP